MLESLNYIAPVLLWVLTGATICIGLIMTVRLSRALINASRALEQMGRALEDIAASLKKNHHATQTTDKETLF